MVGSSNPEPLQHEKGWQRNSVGRLFRFISSCHVYLKIKQTRLSHNVGNKIEGSNTKSSLAPDMLWLPHGHNGHIHADDDLQPQVWLRASGCRGNRTSCCDLENQPCSEDLWDQVTIMMILMMMKDQTMTMVITMLQGWDGQQGAEQEGGDEGERLPHHWRLRQHAQQGWRWWSKMEQCCIDTYLAPESYWDV